MLLLRRPNDSSIHESIGHPLELDRILGDERNYAGSSFVNLDMFGTYKYGSDKLNISFNPTEESELATYNFDDDGTPAKKQYLIKDGILKRPIGSYFSSQRTVQDYVACSRATSWNRPPIDRMGNINLEPGESSLPEMIDSIDNGILLETNNSWSIDDYRNKFQFGCEKGTIIKNGKLKKVVKNPNYRGITKEFWNNLYKVGDKSSFQFLEQQIVERANQTKLYLLDMQHHHVYSKTLMFLVESNERLFSKYRQRTL